MKVLEARGDGYSRVFNVCVPGEFRQQASRKRPKAMSHSSVPRAPSTLSLKSAHASEP